MSKLFHRQLPTVLLILVSMLLSTSTARAISVIEYPIPTPNSGIFGIVLGPDGNIWFAENAADKIGYITPQGVIKEFPLTAGSSPGGLLAGRDGNIWFAERAPARIGRITPAGVLTEFTLPDAASLPGSLTYGPDNNIWFAINYAFESNAAPMIGRISMTGTITTLPVIDPVPNPGGFSVMRFVLDSKNNVLFFITHHSRFSLPNRIYKIDMNGTVTLFDGGVASWLITSLLIDNSGDLWVAGYARHDGFNDGYVLSKISAAGVRTFPNVGGLGELDIFKDSAGNIWTVTVERGGYRLSRTDGQKQFLINASGFPRLMEGVNNDFLIVILQSVSFDNRTLGIQRLSRLKADGSYIEYDLGRKLKFSSVIRGADNNLWFVDSDQNLIGKIVPDEPDGVAVVSAASYTGSVIAPNSIASLFGNALTTSSESADRTPLPDTLAGVKLKVTDRQGKEQFAPLFYASPMQINFLMPAGLQGGAATVSVTDTGGRVISSGSMIIDTTSPGLFSADASGKGLAAAVFLRVMPDGSMRYEPVWQLDAGGKPAPVPIDLTAGGQVYLILFGSGLRGGDTRSSNALVNFQRYIKPDYVGPQGFYLGLDQVNIPLPDTLMSGDASIFLQFADNPLLRRTNTVTFKVK